MKTIKYFFISLIIFVIIPKCFSENSLIYNSIENTIKALSKNKFNSGKVFDKFWADEIIKNGEFIKIIDLDILPGSSDNYIPLLIKFEFSKKTGHYLLKYNSTGQLETITPLVEEKFNTLKSVCLELKPDYSIKEKYYVKDFNDFFLYLPQNSNGKIPLVILFDSFLTEHKNDANSIKRLFNNISEGLASNNIAILKLTTQNNMRSLLTTLENSLDKVLTFPGIQIDLNKIIITGHCENGYITPYIINNLKKHKITGMIIINSSIQPLIDRLLGQKEKQITSDGFISQSERTEIQELKLKIHNLRSNINISDDNNNLPLNFSKSTWEKLINYDLKTTINSINIPSLILFAKNDNNVSVYQFTTWMGMTGKFPGSNFIMYPRANHYLNHGTGLENSSIEKFIKKTVPQYVINDILEWINN